MGKWFEVRRASNSFQRDCLDGTTFAEYTLLSDGTVRIRNECATEHGRRVSTGRAWRTGPRRLHVSFLPLPVWLLRLLPVSAPYDIVYVDDKYKNAVVRSGELWWILSRTSTVSARDMAELMRQVRS